MGDSYSPGLAVRERVTLTKLRELPIPGEVLVRVGDTVRAETPVLRTVLPGELIVVRAAEQLGVEPEYLKDTLKVSIGQTVSRGDHLLERKTFFGLLSSRIKSPSDGTIEFFAEATGHIGLREPPRELTVPAYIDGRIRAIHEGKSVEIETSGTFIQGIFGIGGERSGIVLPLDEPPTERISVRHLEKLAPQLAGAVLVGGMRFDVSALRFAAEHGCVGIVTGSIDSETLDEFLGDRITVSVTGDEDISLSLIITEGFGELPISERILELLRKKKGQRVSLNGATQVRAGAVRPELIVPDMSQDSTQESAADDAPKLQVGSDVRCTRVPFFGERGKIVRLPSELRKVASGVEVRVAEVELGNKRVVIVPRANLEVVVG